MIKLIFFPNSVELTHLSFKFLFVYTLLVSCKGCIDHQHFCGFMVFCMQFLFIFLSCKSLAQELGLDSFLPVLQCWWQWPNNECFVFMNQRHIFDICVIFSPVKFPCVFICNQLFNFYHLYRLWTLFIFGRLL